MLQQRYTPFRPNKKCQKGKKIKLTQIKIFFQKKFLKDYVIQLEKILVFKRISRLISAN